MSVTETRVYAAVADASQVIRTLGIELAFTTFARNKSVANVSSWTSTDGTLGAGAVVSRGTLGVNPTRVRFTEVTSFKRPAEGEGIACHVSWTGADGSQAAQVAVRVDTTSVDAGVDASVVHTGRLVARTLAVGAALGITDPVRIAVVTPWALANSAMSSDCFAVGINTTITARAHTFEVTA